MRGRRLTPLAGRFTPGMSRYALYRKLGGPHDRSGQVRKISPPPGFDPRTIQLQPVAIPTELSLAINHRKYEFLI